MTSPEGTPSKNRHGSGSHTEQQGDDEGTEAEGLNDEEDEEPAAAVAGKAAKSKARARATAPSLSVAVLLSSLSQNKRSWICWTFSRGSLPCPTRAREVGLISKKSCITSGRPSVKCMVTATRS